MPTSQDMTQGMMPADFAERGDRFAFTRLRGLEPDSDELAASPERQFELAFARLGQRLAEAALTPAEVGRVTVFTPDRSFRPMINEPWQGLFPQDGDRPARKTTHAPLEEDVQVELDVVGVRGAARESLEIDGVRHKDPLPMGVRMGRHVFSSVIPADVPGGGRVFGIDAIRQVFDNARSLMVAAGGSLADVQNVWTYLGMWDLHDDMVDMWVEAFPEAGHRPSRKTYWYPSVDIQLQVEGVLGGRRTVLEIPGISHRDPIPMGATCDEVVTTSGVDGRDPETNKYLRGVPGQAQMMLDNLERLLQGSGGDMGGLFHVTALLGSGAYLPAVQQAWAERFPADGPALQFLELGLPARDMLVQVIAEGVLPSWPRVSDGSEQVGE